jgi:hypothetical protein
MLVKLAIAFLLLALTVFIHALGLSLVLRRLPLAQNLDDHFRPRAWLLIRLASWAVAIHCVEISVWALFYWLQKCLPDIESSLYFAIVTYTTVGYGDLVLPQGWRLLAGIEALTGILMCGWTTGFFFGVASRIYLPNSGNTEPD